MRHLKGFIKQALPPHQLPEPPSKTPTRPTRSKQICIAIITCLRHPALQSLRACDIAPRLLHVCDACNTLHCDYLLHACDTTAICTLRTNVYSMGKGHFITDVSQRPFPQRGKSCSPSQLPPWQKVADDQQNPTHHKAAHPTLPRDVCNPRTIIMPSSPSWLSSPSCLSSSPSCQSPCLSSASSLVAPQAPQAQWWLSCPSVP